MSQEFNSNNHTSKNRVTLLLVGIAGGAFVLLACCGGVGLAAVYFLRNAAAPDVLGRWENKEISSLILELRPDGTGTIEVPEARVIIRITHKLQGNELTIAEAPGQNLDAATRDVVERFQRTRVLRTGDVLRLEALAGPGQGQATQLKKIG